MSERRIEILEGQVTTAGHDGILIDGQDYEDWARKYIWDSAFNRDGKGDHARITVEIFHKNGAWLPS